MGIQNPGPQKFWEVKSRALSKFSDFIVCVSSYLQLHYTYITQSTDICNYFRVLSERQNKNPESILDSKKEVLPYIVFVFLFVFKLNFYSNKNKFAKNLIPTLTKSEFLF